MRKIPTWLNAVIFLLIGIALVIGIPFLINESYWDGKGYQTIWGATDVFLYYGTIIAAVIGVAGVYLSIQAANKNYREDVKARVLPFIALTLLDAHTRVNLLDLLLKAEENLPKSEQREEDSIEYCETKLERIFYVISAGRKITPKEDLKKEQYEIIKSCGNKWVTNASGGKSLIQIDYVSIPFEIENVGNGTAVNLRIGFYEAKSKPHYIRPMMLKQNQSLYIHIFSSEEFDVICGDYIFEVHYEDIYGNKYLQKFPVEFGIQEDGKKYQSITIIGRQESIREDIADADT